MTITRDTTGWTEADASGLRDTPGERWYSCAKCGQLFPSSELMTEEPSGARYCVTGPHDYDEPTASELRSRDYGSARLFPGSEEVTE